MNFKKGDKVTIDGYSDRYFIIGKYVRILGVEIIDGVIRPKSHFLIEDFHDKNTPKRKGHLSFSIREDEIYKIKLKEKE